MYYTDIFYLLTIILFFVSMICSGVVRSRFNRYSKDRTYNGMTGAMAAERILRANGITDVTIVQTQGTLTDNYNPANHTLNLSQPVYGGQNVSAVAVAAHECGHAIQHAQAYPLLMLRKALVPICNIGSIGSYIAILLGIFFSRSGLITLGAVLFSGIVLFNLVTLPVEVDASRRAMAEVDRRRTQGPVCSRDDLLYLADDLHRPAAAAAEHRKQPEKITDTRQHPASGGVLRSL